MKTTNSLTNSIYHRPLGRLLLAVFCAAFLWLAIQASITIGQSSQPSVEVVFISINHGDSILLRSSKGENVLIDAGYPEAGTLAYLQTHNINHLNAVIATHAHEDHIGGIPEVLRDIEIDRIIENGQEIDSTYYVDLQKAIQETGIRRQVVRTGDRIPFGELTFHVLNPSRIRPDWVNNNSIVLSLSVGKIKFLFTGDIEKPIETRLVNSRLDIQADILKVAHHAGATSSDPAFLAAVHPTVAIYSASNFFPGFPDESTIDTIRMAGAKVYGTNFNGTITLQTDGKTYSISTEHGDPLLPY